MVKVFVGVAHSACLAFSISIVRASLGNKFILSAHSAAFTDHIFVHGAVTDSVLILVTVRACLANSISLGRAQDSNKFFLGGTCGACLANSISKTFTGFSDKFVLSACGASFANGIGISRASLGSV